MCFTAHVKLQKVCAAEGADNKACLDISGPRQTHKAIMPSHKPPLDAHIFSQELKLQWYLIRPTLPHLWGISERHAKPPQSIKPIVAPQAVTTSVTSTVVTAYARLLLELMPSPCWAEGLGAGEPTPDKLEEEDKEDWAAGVASGPKTW